MLAPCSVELAGAAELSVFDKLPDGQNQVKIYHESNQFVCVTKFGQYIRELMHVYVTVLTKHKACLWGGGTFSGQFRDTLVRVLQTVNSKQNCEKLTVHISAAYEIF